MNGEEAAKELGISVRSLQRAVGREALHVTYKRGKSGKQEAVYDPKEVARYKAELEEAGALSGISEGALLDAIHRQELKAVLNKLGRGYRVKRTHLEAFAESFDNEQ